MSFTSLTTVVTTLSQSQARRIALAAQGFLDKPHDQPTMRTLARTVERTGVLQVDSVNVLQRAHFMPLYSRMGSYDVDLLARAQTVTGARKPRRLVEYWAHVQALMPVELWPLMQHRMDSYRNQRHKWWGSEVSEELVAKGMNNREIAKQLFISENTVKNHVRNLLEKLQLHSRMEAVMYAVREKLLDLP